MLHQDHHGSDTVPARQELQRGARTRESCRGLSVRPINHAMDKWLFGITTKKKEEEKAHGGEKEMKSKDQERRKEKDSQRH